MKRLNGQQKKFCRLYALEKNAKAAYKEAYGCSDDSAEAAGPRLLGNVRIQEEIAQIRRRADEIAGAAAPTLAEKRAFCGELLRARVANLPRDSHLWQSIKVTESGIEYRLPDKLKAIEVDNDLAGEGSEAIANDALSSLIARAQR